MQLIPHVAELLRILVCPSAPLPVPSDAASTAAQLHSAMRAGDDSVTHSGALTDASSFSFSCGGAASPFAHRPASAAAAAAAADRDGHYYGGRSGGTNERDDDEEDEREGGQEEREYGRDEVSEDEGDEGGEYEEEEEEDGAADGGMQYKAQPNKPIAAAAASGKTKSKVSFIHQVALQYRVNACHTCCRVFC